MKATLVDDIDIALGVPGAIELRTRQGDTKVAGIAFVCPCGCGREGWLPIVTERRPETSPAWTWDGNREAPTLTPSVLQVGGCRWHGWLRAGLWETC